MAASHTTTTLDGLFKEVYADKIESLVPEVSKLQKKYPFKKTKKIGDSYHQPVVVQRSHGVTRGRGVQTLNNAIVSISQDAQLNPLPFYLRELLGYDQAQRMSGSKEAFIQGTKHLVQQLLESASYRQEIEMLYGKTGLGATTSSANDSSTQTTITLTDASWAPGIWAGSENASLVFHQDSDDALVSSGADSLFTIDAISVANKTIQVTGTATGITALDSAISSETTCSIMWSDSYSAAKGDLENSGFDQITTNTGTLFNIAGGTYGLWQGNTFAVGGAFTMRKALAGVAVAVGRGLTESSTVWTSPTTFENLNQDQAALRTYDSSYKKSDAESGSEKITYYGCGGKLTIEPHIYVKEGEAFLIPDKRVVMTGGTPITFNVPGRGKEGAYFRDLDTQTGLELRIMHECGVMITKPAASLKFTGIVNT